MSSTRCLPLLAALFFAGAPASADAQEVRTATFDVSGDWVFLDFGSPEPLLEVSDPLVSDEWDLGILSTTISVNGGESGPGDVVAYCICANQALSDPEIQAITADTELAEFEAVTAANVPTDPSAWGTTAFDASPWYRYNLAGQHMIWPTYDVYLVKRGDEVYKVQLTNFYGPGGEPRQLTVRYARLAG